jgi:3-hydroxyisobutyrate dehydrogenase-like beta-hydroxyacid dehydrogenase
MEKIGFIGVGNMGGRMAKNILGAGYELTAFDIQPEPVEGLVKLGAKRAETPKMVGQNSDVVFTMVMNGDQIKAILNGPDGLLTSLRPGATLICTATILRSEMIEIGKILAPKEVEVIDSPVSGGAPGAEAGTLTMMVACSKSVLDSNRQILEAVGQNIYHVGEDIGMGQTVKAALAALTGVTYAGIF